MFRHINQKMLWLFATTAKNQMGYTTDPNKVKMKDTDFNKLREANTGPLSETESLFSKMFTLFLECLYYGNKEPSC